MEVTTRPRRRTRRFRHFATFVAVKPIKLSSIETIQPGESMPKRLRRFHLRALWMRMRIGEVGDPWTEYQVAAWKAKMSSEPIKPPEPERKLVVESGGLQVFDAGGGWFSVEDASGTVVDRLRGQKALDSWVRESAPPPKDPPESEPEKEEASTEE